MCNRVFCDEDEEADFQLMRKYFHVFMIQYFHCVPIELGDYDEDGTAHD